MRVVTVCGRLYWHLDFQDWFGLVFVQRSTAFSAKIVIGPKLDEMTMVATYHFPGIDWR
jgi:hypothetical protein